MSNRPGSWPAGLKHTRQREQVRDILLAADRPLRAADIYEQWRTAGNQVSLSTIYRILEAFEKAGTVERSMMPGDETAFYKWREADGEHRHYATCLICHRQIPLEGCPIGEMKLPTETPGFTITGHRIELFGYCEECGRKQNL